MTKNGLEAVTLASAPVYCVINPLDIIEPFLDELKIVLTALYAIR